VELSRVHIGDEFSIVDKPTKMACKLDLGTFEAFLLFFPSLDHLLKLFDFPFPGIHFPRVLLLFFELLLDGNKTGNPVLDVLLSRFSTQFSFVYLVRVQAFIRSLGPRQDSPNFLLFVEIICYQF